MRPHARWAHGALGSAVLLLLTGCTTLAPETRFGEVAALVRERAGPVPQWHRQGGTSEAVRTRIAELLSEPLTADAAVEIALLSSPALQARFHDLGIAEADLVQAGRLRNPTFSFGRLSGGGHVEIERAVVFNLLGVLTLPLSSEFAHQQFAQTQLEVAGDAVALAADARRAYFTAVTSAELVRYFDQVRASADAAAELARRMAQAGNFSKLAHMREQAFYADAAAQLARAQHQARADRERLGRMLGLTSSDDLRLPDRLPDLPAQPTEPVDAERLALERRFDVLAARQSAAAFARALNLSRATRFVNVLEVGYQNKSTTDEPRANGYELELELPLFDFGSTRVARAEATYMRAVERTAEIALNARSQVREAYSAYRTTYDLAKHYRDEVVPLRKRISEESLLRYNGMLIGVFELLADSREQVGSVTAAIEALRDFWLADTDLQAAISGRGPGERAPVTRPSSAPPAAGAGH